jgi:N-acetylglucosaminyldiphosphoundecaprenol N-acetyl-beta-D-mannosaminyltransferase
MQEGRIFGVKIDDIGLKETQDRLDRALQGAARCLVTTPNPEILLQAAADKNYAALLNRADLSLPDGRGLRLVGAVQATTAGADVAQWLLEKAGHERRRILAVVRPDGLSSVSEVAAALARLAPGAQVKAIGLLPSQISSWLPVEAAAAWRPEILLVGLGFPLQEEWLLTRASHLPTLRVGLAVGGTFDYWTGRALRAPAWLRRLGLEWLWRLGVQPRRWRRIFRAVVVFPWRYTRQERRRRRPR